MKYVVGCSVRRENNEHSPNFPARADGWDWSSPSSHRILRVKASGYLFLKDQFENGLVIRGYIGKSDARTLATQQEIAEALIREFAASGTIKVESLEGNFTLIAMQGNSGRLVAYRNLCHGTNTYYINNSNEFWIGSNLPELIKESGLSAAPNDQAVPAVFLFRTVYGRETLFEGIYRLQPGELLEFDGNQLLRTQRRRLGNLVRPSVKSEDFVESLESTMLQVIRDIESIDKGTVNLLSGGVDSCYLQSAWNRVCGNKSGKPMSVSIGLEHRRGKGENEYAESAAINLNTAHTVVQGSNDIARALQEQIRGTGELPNHLQSVYFSGCAAAIRNAGRHSGLCGEGADGLFGGDGSRVLLRARTMYKCLPNRLLRAISSRAFEFCRLPYWSQAAKVSEILWDTTCNRHPINEISVFSDTMATELEFPQGSIARVLESRRQMVAAHSLPKDILLWVEMAAFLGEAIQTAAVWTTLFELQGVELICPFLDSRIISVGLNMPTNQRHRNGFGKWTLRSALSRNTSHELSFRKKRSFGQPVFEYLAPGGCLYPLVQEIGTYSFVSKATIDKMASNPSWSLYSLLCYDLWYKTFVEKTYQGP